MTNEQIQELATPAQWRAWTAVEEHGSISAAAESLGQDRRGVARLYRSLEAKMVAAGHGTPASRLGEGQRLKGTSTLYDADGQVRQTWVKTEKDDRRDEAMRLVIDELVGAVTPLAGFTSPDRFSREGLVGYPVGDLHLGMLAWGQENGGESWDLKIGQDVFQKAFGYLVETAFPAADALLAFMGDFMHYDSAVPVTPTAGNNLDADGRFPKMVRAAITMMRFAIETAARKHKRVRVIIEIGNHDLYSSIFLAEAMRALYSNNEAISIDTSPAHYHHFEYGANLIATHHGHGAKMAQLPGIMATDWPEQWGRTTHRVWWTGHVHHQRVQEFPGCTVESLRVLAPKDAWHSQRGYRSMRGMQCVSFHPIHGEVSRTTVKPEMFQ